jgi:hypothetical protein
MWTRDIWRRESSEGLEGPEDPRDEENAEMKQKDHAPTQ